MPCEMYHVATWVAMDVSRDEVVAAIVMPGEDVPVVERLFHDIESVSGLMRRLGDRRWLRVCYEAGPTGYPLARALSAMGISCEVIAPAKVPKASANRVKTDRRDARELVGLFRAGLLTPIRVPTETEEAVRDLCRTRADALDDLLRVRRRLSAFLLRHGRVWRQGSTWTLRHQSWLRNQQFTEPALGQSFRQYLGMLETRECQLESLNHELVPFFDREPFAEVVHRLGAYRGVDYPGALTVAAEVCDFRRFATASRFMGFIGLVPTEHSSGSVTRRGHLTKTGNAAVRTQLIQSAWAYQHHPAAGAALTRRQEGLDPQTIARAWAAQQRLCRRFRTLDARKPARKVVVAAIARELAGFLWAEMTTHPAPPEWRPQSA